jgi:glycosyltransferase involved in cell wall biosynthesis
VFLTPYAHGPFTDSTAEHAHLWGARLAPALITLGALALPLLARRTGLQVVHDPTGLSPFIERSAPYGRVVTLHDATALTHADTHTWLDVFLHRVYLPLTLRNVDAVITPSCAARDDLVRWFRLDPRRVHVVEWGVDTAFRPDPHATNTEAPYVLYVGALEPRKNLERLLHAFAQVRAARTDVQLLVVGAKRWKTSRIARTVDALDLHQAVHFTGYVPDADLPALYSAASVFCYPSLAEGFGLPVLEAMACGTPVVCSSTSSRPEVAGDAAVLVNPLRPEDIAQALLKVLGDTDLAQSMRERGPARAQTFTWERTAQRTVDVYRHVLGQ